MDYRDPEGALRAKKQALEELLAEADRDLHALEAAAPPKQEAPKLEVPEAPSTDGPMNVLFAILAVVIAAIGLAGALVASTKLPPWTFDHSAVAPPAAPAPTLEGRVVTVTAPITAAEAARDDELLVPGEEIAIERVVETGRWHAAYRVGGRGGGERPAGYDFKPTPEAMAVASKAWRGRGVRVGGYQIDFDAAPALPLEDLPIDAARVRKHDGPLAWDSDRRAISAPVSTELHPDIVLVRHRALRSGATVTVLGVQHDGRLVPLTGAPDGRDGLFVGAGDRAALRSGIEGTSAGWTDAAPVAACLLCIVLGCFAMFTEVAAIFVGGLILAVFSIVGLVVGLIARDPVLDDVVGAAIIGVLIVVGSKAFSSGRAFLLAAACLGLAAGTVALAPYIANSSTAIAAYTAGVSLVVFIVRRAYGWNRTLVSL